MATNVFVAKCAKCKVKRELEVCQVCDEAKCKECAAQHVLEVTDKWDTLGISLSEVNARYKNYIRSNENSLKSLEKSLEQVRQAYEERLARLKSIYDKNVKHISNLIKTYRSKTDRVMKEWEAIETSETYRQWIRNGRQHLLNNDPTDVEMLVERLQRCLREEYNEEDFIGSQFKFERKNDVLSLGEIHATKDDDFKYHIDPRRLKICVRRQYPDIEERIARVTDSKRLKADVLRVLNDPHASRTARMEAVAWIAVCEFNCRIFGGYVRDWIVGGYASKITELENPIEWVIYTTYGFETEQIPRVDKRLVPNDIDCYLPNDDFSITRFLSALHGYGIDCGTPYETDSRYVLLLDEDRSPFTMDLITVSGASHFHKHRILDIDVNNLFIEKDYVRELGMRTDLQRTQDSQSYDLETIVRHIKAKEFIAMRTYDIQDRIEKLIARGWTQADSDEAEEFDEHLSDE